MRTVSGAEQTVLEKRHYAQFLKVEVEDDVAAFQNISELGGRDWVLQAEVSQNVDQRVIAGRVTFARERGGTVQSLAPMVAGSNPYADFIKEGRRIKISAATKDIGSNPISADWKLLLDGVIDTWDAAKWQMPLDCRDLLGAKLATRIIEDPTEYDAENITARMQNILDDWADSETLNGATPTHALPKTVQEQMNVFAALQRYAQEIGYVVDIRWDNTANEFQIQLVEPNRSASVVDWTFNESHYFDVPTFRRSRLDIRNRIVVRYIASATGALTKKVVEDTTSQTDYNTIATLVFNEGTDSGVDNDSKAGVLAQAALDDLKDPYVQKEIVVPLSWWVQLGDYIGLTANDIHYTSDQKLAIVGYRHVFRSTGVGRTHLRLRGQPVAGVRTWISRPRTTPRPKAQVFPQLNSSDELTASIDGDQFTHSVRVVASKDGTKPTEAEIEAQTPLNGQNFTTTDVGTIQDVDDLPNALTWAAGDGPIILGWIAYAEANGGGVRSQVMYREWDPGAVQLLKHKVFAVQVGDTVTVTVEIVDDPAGIVQHVRFKSHNAGGDFDFSDPTDGSWVEDASAPYQGTVVVQGKHNWMIAFAIGTDDGASGTDYDIIDFRSGDPSNDPNLRGHSVGFGDDGFAIFNLIGDEDTIAVAYNYKRDADPSAAPVAGSLTTTDAAITASDTSCSVVSSTGFSFGNYMLIVGESGGSPVSEVIYIRSVSAGNINVKLTGGFQNSYDSGAAVTEISNTGGDTSNHDGGGALLTQAGFQDSTGVVNQGPSDSNEAIEMGERIHYYVLPISATELGSPLGPFRRRRGDTEFIKPAVEVTALRSTDDVQVVLEISDPTLAIAADADIKFAGRGEDDQTYDSLVSTWDVSTGTAGSAQTLTRKETFTDSFIGMRWQITYVDENGDPQTLGDTISFSDVVQVSKTIRFPASQVVPESDAVDWSYTPTTGEGIALFTNGGGVNRSFYANFPFPAGIKLTEVRGRVFEEVSGDETSISVKAGDSAIATLISSATSWATKTASLSKTTVVTESYWAAIALQPASGSSDPGVAYIEFDYDSPSYHRSY